MGEWMHRLVDTIGFEPPLLQQRQLPPNAIPSLMVYTAYYYFLMLTVLSV